LHRKRGNSSYNRNLLHYEYIIFRILSIHIVICVSASGFAYVYSRGLFYPTMVVVQTVKIKLLKMERNRNKVRECKKVGFILKIVQSLFLLVLPTNQN